MNCREATPLMHDYLDGELKGAQVTELKQHLLACPACRSELDGLEQAEAFIRVMPQPMVSDGFADRIMRAIPQPGRRTRFKRLVKRHPAISVAVVFLMVMVSSFFSLGGDKEHEIMVKGADLEGIFEIRGDTVIVPFGQTVHGNLMIEHGKLQVDGTIEGNIVLVDGSINLASTASIAGQVTSVNETVDYLWYKVKEFMSGFSRK